MLKNKSLVGKNLIKFVFLVLICLFITGGFSTIWAISLPVPDFETFFQQQINETSTKIYDRTGEVLLYDVRGIRRTVVPFEQIPASVKLATLAIEDANFYNHGGIEVSAIARALFVDVLTGGLHQGGSTITQQVVKNSLLTQDKTITRKIKEAILAVKMEKTMSKDKILNIYLNETPYGSNIYGVQEAARAYFKKDVTSVTLAESAYLAAMPQAPNYYSPYGANRDKLEERKNLVLDRMAEVGFVTKAQADQAKKEKVTFYEKINQSIKAPHFAYYIEKYLEDKYGKEEIETRGYKVITTIDWDLQQKAEELAKKYGEDNQKNFNASNNGLVVISPKTGQILVMVGSRDYFNQDIQGNFNVTTAHRQPGSSFKPFVYATAFNKGYTDKTVVFDLKTEFNTNCNAQGKPVTPGAVCYMPQNYDNKYVGPITFRNALAQSRNIPSIKVLYLAGINDSLETAKKMGITSLGGKNQYGLTLVLGGGEVSLLEMTGAYGVFANDGVKVLTTGILKVIDPNGNVIEEFKDSNQNQSTLAGLLGQKPTLSGERVLPENTVRLISNILSDEEARIPAYGSKSYLYFADRDVAVKTGTTNDYKDAWIIGYTPDVVVGAWAGNNDNKPMAKKVAGFIIAPLWHAVMQEALNKTLDEKFVPPIINYNGLKPVLRGYWQGNNAQYNNGIEYLTSSVHSILYWLDKNNPNGPVPSNPNNDPQFTLWEYPVRNWLAKQNILEGQLIPTSEQSNLNLTNQIQFMSPLPSFNYSKNNQLKIELIIPPGLLITRVDYFLNNLYLGSIAASPYSYSFVPNQFNPISGNNEIKAIIYDQNKNTLTKSVQFNLN